jgi:hypothetical protein
VAPTLLPAIEAAAGAAAAGVPLAPAEASAVIAAAAEPALPKGKKKASRMNWGAGIPLQRMTQAIEDKKGEHFKEGTAFKHFPIAARMQRETFQKYAQGKRALGKSIGRPGHLDGDEYLFVVDSVRRRDRARDGLGPGEITYMVQELNQSLPAKQARNAASALRAKNKDVLTKSTTAQATTKARVAVNIPGQCCWHEVPGMNFVSYSYALGFSP